MSQESVVPVPVVVVVVVVAAAATDVVGGSNSVDERAELAGRVATFKSVSEVEKASSILGDAETVCLASGFGGMGGGVEAGIGTPIGGEVDMAVAPSTRLR
jgi:hypothetical protein